VAARVSKSLKRQRARQQRMREYEADPETLHPDDRPSSGKLRVDPAAVADLAKAMGFSR